MGGDDEHGEDAAWRRDVDRRSVLVLGGGVQRGQGLGLRLVQGTREGVAEARFGAVFAFEHGDHRTERGFWQWKVRNWYVFIQSYLHKRKRREDRPKYASLERESLERWFSLFYMSPPLLQVQVSLYSILFHWSNQKRLSFVLLMTLQIRGGRVPEEGHGHVWQVEGQQLLDRNRCWQNRGRFARRIARGGREGRGHGGQERLGQVVVMRAAAIPRGARAAEWKKGILPVPINQ